MTTAPKPGKRGSRGQRPNRLVAFLKERWLPLLILVLVFIFVGTNGQKVTVHLFGAHFKARMWLLLLITAALGFLAGWLFSNRRRHLKAAANAADNSGRSAP
jgi:putative membrane protein